MNKEIIGLKGIGKTERNASIFLDKYLLSLDKAMTQVEKSLKPKKKKTYVLTVSVKFPKKGIEVQKSTGFKKKILDGTKRHTIRSNYEFWKKRIDEINAGNAILSVRQWTGKPYNSKQVEITQFTKLGYQEITISKNGLNVHINNNGVKPFYMSDRRIITLAKNDGLELKQFQDWFSDGMANGIIIHFTHLKYK